MTHSIDEPKKPLEDPPKAGFWRIVIIVLSGHLGVRTARRRREDFAQANGLAVFFVAVTYFVLIIIGLIILVNFIAAK